MKNKVTLTIGVILMIGLATAMYAGENSTVAFSGDVRDCYASGALYNVTGLNLTENGRFVHLYTQRDFKPDNITIICEVRGEKEEYSGGDGGEGWVAPRNKKVPDPVIPPTIIPNTTVPYEGTPTIEPEEEKSSLEGILLVLSGLFVVIVLITVGLVLFKKEPVDYLEPMRKEPEIIEPDIIEPKMEDETK